MLQCQHQAGLRAHLDLHVSKSPEHKIKLTAVLVNLDNAVTTCKQEEDDMLQVELVLQKKV